MNPYLKLKKDIPVTTYFYASGVLKTAWPETEPVSSMLPTPEIKIVEERGTGMIPNRLNCAEARISVSLGGQLAGEIKMVKCLALGTNGFFEYDQFHPNLQSITRTFMSHFPHSESFLIGNLIPAMIDVGEAWTPPTPDLAKLSTVVSDHLLFTKYRYKVESIEHKPLEVNIYFGVWPFGKRLLPLFTVDIDMELVKQPKDFLSNLHFSAEEALYYAYEVLDYYAKNTDTEEVVKPYHTYQVRATPEEGEEYGIEDYKEYEEAEEEKYYQEKYGREIKTLTPEEIDEEFQYNMHRLRSGIEDILYPRPKENQAREDQPIEDYPNDDS